MSFNSLASCFLGLVGVLLDKPAGESDEGWMETIGRLDPRLHRISKVLLVVFEQREIAPAEAVDGLPVVPHTEQCTRRVLGFQGCNLFCQFSLLIIKCI